MPASTAACTVATHSSKLVVPHSMPSPPPPRVSVETGGSLPNVCCCMLRPRCIREPKESRERCVHLAQRGGVDVADALAYPCARHRRNLVHHDLRRDFQPGLLCRLDGDTDQVLA